MANIGENNQRLAEALIEKPKREVIIPKYPGSDRPLDSYSKTVPPTNPDPFPPAVLADHIREFEKSGKKHRIAELTTTVTYRIVNRGRKWFEAVVMGVPQTKALVEINDATEHCIRWQTYELTGRVTIDCTYSNFRKIHIYPTEARLIPKNK
jgi:hypothetical protein